MYIYIYIFGYVIVVIGNYVCMIQILLDIRSDFEESLQIVDLEK